MMSTPKSGKRPLSWFGLRLSGRGSKPNQENAETCSQNTSILKSEDTTTTAVHVSPKKDKMGKNVFKSNKKGKHPQKLKNAGQKSAPLIGLPSVTSKGNLDSFRNAEDTQKEQDSSVSQRLINTNSMLKNIGSSEPRDATVPGQTRPLSPDYPPQDEVCSNTVSSLPNQSNSKTLKNTTVLLKTSNERSVQIGVACSVSGNGIQRSRSISPSVTTAAVVGRHQENGAPEKTLTSEQQPTSQVATALSSTPLTQSAAAITTTYVSVSAESKGTPTPSVPKGGSVAQVTGTAAFTTLATTISSSSTATTTTTPTVKIPPRPRYNLNFIGDLQSKHKFSMAVCKQNDVANSAIESLGCLNEQIIQYILSAQGSIPDPGSPPPPPLSPVSPISHLSAENGKPSGWKELDAHQTNFTPCGGPVDASSKTGSSVANLNLSSPAAHASMVIIRRLLVDAQTRFRRMVEDNRQLAAHIDSSIQSANQEVCLLRAELASTNKRLSKMSSEEMARADVAIQVELSNLERKSSNEKENDATYREDIEALIKGNEQLVEEYRHLLQDHKTLSLANDELKADNDRLKGECSRLESQLRNLNLDYDVLVKEVKAEQSPSQCQDQQSAEPEVESKSEASASTATVATPSKPGPPVAPRPSYGELKLELIQARQELNRAKEMLHGMKSDRKRLKGEKLDLLSQMKQLYTTLEEKETELRDFIKNYEQRVKESDEMIKQLAKEKKQAERDKWDIVSRAKDASERAVSLKAQLDAKDVQLTEAKKKLSSQDEEPATDGATTNANSSVTSVPIIDEGDDDIFFSVNDKGISTLEESSVLNCTIAAEGTQASPSVLTAGSGGQNSGSASPSSQAFRWFTQSSDFDLGIGEAGGAGSGTAGDGGGGSQGDAGGGGGGEGGGEGGLLRLGKGNRSNKKKKTAALIGGSLSRVFSRGKMRRSLAIPHAEAILGESLPKLSVLSQDNYQEKLATIEKMVGVPMREWRAHQVLAWLEITLAMPMYAQNCLTNVKSGKVLLGLSDSELSAAMGVTNTMHRRKLRLAIEQHRNPDEITYIKASEMDPTWVSHRLLPDLGLPQYTDVFEQQLCDGHVLNTLTRRDLEKHFSVHRKFHQSSILHAVELMRRIDFNKEKLYHRRNQSEDKDTDLIVWTNERLMKWLRTIDLGEYSESLMESGVHGALMVLEPSFNTDSLASILGIPPSKSYITRHLSTELDKILKPARAALDPCDQGEKSLDVTMRGKSTSSKGGKGSQEKEQRKSQHMEKLQRSVSMDNERRKSQEEGRWRLSFRGSFGRAFGKKAGANIRLKQESKTRTARVSAPISIVITPDVVPNHAGAGLTMQNQLTRVGEAAVSCNSKSVDSVVKQEREAQDDITGGTDPPCDGIDKDKTRPKSENIKVYTKSASSGSVVSASAKTVSTSASTKARPSSFRVTVTTDRENSKTGSAARINRSFSLNSVPYETIRLCNRSKQRNTGTGNTITQIPSARKKLILHHSHLPMSSKKDSLDKPSPKKSSNVQAHPQNTHKSEKASCFKDRPTLIIGLADIKENNSEYSLSVDTEKSLETQLSRNVKNTKDPQDRFNDRSCTSVSENTQNTFSLSQE